MAYVDGFVAAVPHANKDAFIEHARAAMAVFKEYGCIGGRECWADDVPKGEVTDFWRAVKAGADETVVFSWLVWPDKATRDAGMARLMEDPRMSPETNPMPFDGKRLIYGGFETVLEY